MKMITCIKAVPGDDSIRFDHVTGTLCREGTGMVINPYDMVAVELALQCREAVGGSITGVSMGPKVARTGLETAITMGIDQGILLSSPKFGGSDVPATAYVLSQFIQKELSYDVIFCGAHSADGDTGQVGSWLGELLGIPHICCVSEIMEIQEHQIIVKQELESVVYEIAVPYPCLVIIGANACYPRRITLSGMLKGKRANIKEVSEKEIPELDMERCGVRGSRTQVRRIRVPKGERKGKQISIEELGEILVCMAKGKEES